MPDYCAMPDGEGDDQNRGKPLISPELVSALTFIGDENKRHQEYFKQLYNRTIGLLFVLVVSAGAIATFLGLRTFSDYRQIVRREADEAIKQEIERIRKEVREQVASQFQTQNIKSMVQEQAKAATETTLKPIITAEVDRQVSNEKPLISQTASSAVKTIVDNQLTPEIRKVQGDASFSSLLEGAENCDAKAFDQLVPMVSDKAIPENMRHMAKNVVDSITGTCANGGTNLCIAYGLMDAGGVLRKDDLVAQMGSADRRDRLSALEYLHNEPSRIVARYKIPNQRTPLSEWPAEARIELGKLQNRHIMDKVVDLLTDDDDLAVRNRAFDTLSTLASTGSSYGLNFACYDKVIAKKWWQDHRQDFER
jgi:hypothetical protein